MEARVGAPESAGSAPPLGAAFSLLMLLPLAGTAPGSRFATFAGGE